MIKLWVKGSNVVALVGILCPSQKQKMRPRKHIEVTANGILLGSGFIGIEILPTNLDILCVCVAW